MAFLNEAPFVPVPHPFNTGSAPLPQPFYGGATPTPRLPVPPMPTTGGPHLPVPPLPTTGGTPNPNYHPYVHPAHDYYFWGTTPPNQQPHVAPVPHPPPPHPPHGGGPGGGGSVTPPVTPPPPPGQVYDPFTHSLFDLGAAQAGTLSPVPPWYAWWQRYANGG